MVDFAPTPNVISQVTPMGGRQNEQGSPIENLIKKPSHGFQSQDYLALPNFL
jgi:hypothetical protein